MQILSLDPGMTTGWAKLYWEGMTTCLDGYGEIPIFGDGIDALLDSTWRWLNEHATVEEIAFEGPIRAYGIKTRIELHEVRGVIREWCVWKGIPYAEYVPATVKASVTGKANATKKQVADAMKRQFGVPRFPTDHASDAVAVGATHLNKKYGARLGDRYTAAADSERAGSGDRVAQLRGGSGRAR